MEISNTIFWYALLTVAVLFIISGIDDLIFDIGYWSIYFYRKIKYRKKIKSFKLQKAIEIPEKKIALIIPCWQESTVIPGMLKYNIPKLYYENYDVFVGVYPNDKKSIKVLNEISSEMNNLHIVVADHDGPTNKADNLNSIYKYLINHEKDNKNTYKILVMHDVEDVVHPLSLKFFNYLIEEKKVIQVPVYPLEVPNNFWVHWTYNDEFSEMHTKELVFREAIKGFVPSAGVGTAFHRDAINDLAKQNNDMPFSIESFTEDYNSTLRLSKINYKEIFMLHKISRVKFKKKFGFFGKKVPKTIQEPIATRSLFPTTYSKAVKQRSRWILGISFQEWSLSGITGNLSTKYLLFHDRKGIITNFIAGFGYIILLYWIIIYIMSLFDPSIVTLSDYFNAYPETLILVYITTAIMLQRIFERCIATYRIYGFLASLLSIPRIFVSNIINMHALTRALLVFLHAVRKKKQTPWSKTTNFFPTDEQLLNYTNKLGDLLINTSIIENQDLINALNEQSKTGEKLGYILLRQKKITEDQLLYALSKIAHLTIAKIKKADILKKNQIKHIKPQNYDWLIEHYIFPIKISKDKIITMAISDPETLLLIKETQLRIEPYKCKFVITKWGAHLKDI